jgi:peptidoglycan/LPS O-acetylase OafA/YrhL
VESALDRDNNFGIVRLIGALFVIAGHNQIIIGALPPMLFGEQIQALGLEALIVTGGYFICQSWMRDSNVLRYAIRRFMRIVPPLFACCFVTVFVFGPILTTLKIEEYFIQGETYQYFYNVLMYPVYSLPGVFADNIYPAAVNGSLWSLPPEMGLYVLVPAAIVLTRVNKTASNKSQLLFLLITLVFVGLQWFHISEHPAWRLVVYGTDLGTALKIVPFWLMGSVFALPLFKRFLNLQISVVLLLVCSVIPLNEACREIALIVAFPYFICSFGCARPAFFAKLVKGKEVSYGMYLYGFLVSQSIVALSLSYGIALQPLGSLLICLVLTFVLAFLSYWLIEQPSLKLSKKMTAALQKNNQG